MARRASNLPLRVPGITPVRVRDTLDMSVTGFVYTAMMLFMGLAAVHSQANLLFGVFGLMIGILLIAYLMSRVVLRKIHVERDLPEHAVVGRPCVFNYRVINRKRFWPTLALTVSELDSANAFQRQPQSYLLHVAAKMTAQVPCEVLPRRRGLHHLERYQLSTSFPFGFIKRAETKKARDSLLIYPALAEVHPQVLSLARSAEKTGSMMRPRRGGSDEFYGVKDYRAGESPRWIYWRRSARTGALVSKEMTHVSPPRVMIVVDTLTHDENPETIVLTEHSIALAASLASHALETGLPVGLIAWSEELIQVLPNRGKRHCRDLLTILAQLPRNTTYDVQSALQSGRLMPRKSGTTTFLVTARGAAISRAEQARGGTIVLSPTSEQTRSWFRFDPAIDFQHSEPSPAPAPIGPAAKK